ncbi:hypothetical protein [Novispirillum itersonii]|uniref:hypothetical protein n=1 Tax=Novispirillum itersonii TaxID=189 RepID=UPI00035E1109|nr:hypothetical protein [Novispirillum itersonii]
MSDKDIYINIHKPVEVWRRNESKEVVEIIPARVIGIINRKEAVVAYKGYKDEKISTFYSNGEATRHDDRCLLLRNAPKRLEGWIVVSPRMTAHGDRSAIPRVFQDKDAALAVAKQLPGTVAPIKWEEPQ